MPRLALLAVLLPAFASAAEPVRKIDFEQDVRPIFGKHCHSCHGPDKQKGGLRLDVKADAVKGGDSGVALVAGKPAESLLLKLVSGEDADRAMPPKGDRLTKDQLATIRLWIEQGAEWKGAETADRRDWWSLKPLTKPAVPNVKGVSNPIDAFVRAKLAEKGLTPSSEADKRTLIRRVSYDLTGLPPKFEEVEAFAENTAADAYEKLVDKLLASPRYGERWARHWLDVVHYGDTHGYDKDKPRPNAWPYRDYVIRALNEDKPYARFVREQVAGDVLHPNTMDGVTALGFLAAGPWDFIGHAEVPESKIDGKIARHLDRDDMVATTMNTFASLTAQCAQCHNHKFDPISQKEYYQLQAVFAAIDRADKPYHADPKVAKRAAELTAKRDILNAKQAEYDAALRKACGEKLIEIDRRIAAANESNARRAEFGYHSQIAPKSDAAKWVQIDLGASVQLAEVVLWPCHDDFNGIGAGFGFPVRFKVESSDDVEFKNGVKVLVEHAADVKNPGVAAQTIPVAAAKGRYLRVTATKLTPRRNDYNFALAEVEALDTAGRNLAAGAAVSALDSIEAPNRWRKSNLTDGFAPGKGGGDLAALAAERQQLIAKFADPAMAAVAAELAAVEHELGAVPPTGRVYAGTVHSGSGAFRGTGPSGAPREIFVLKRGDVKSPNEEVGPGAPGVFKEFDGKFDLSPNHSEGDRRAALARWLTDAKNPLSWRSVVNRVWHYHFGRGIVATPNDFGRMGQLPTHPELLDYLAAEFRDGGQSLKKLHKLIVTSATYKQVSAGNAMNDAQDASNAYLWRANRRKLEAEAIRDSALLAAGKLDLKMYGPAFQDFVVEHPEHSPHYEYHLFDPNDPSAYRRSVYRFLARSKPQPFMTVLDCADPSMQVDQRIETLSPLQALALFNNGFMLAMSKHLATRVEKAGDLAAQVNAAFRFTLGREPSKAESEALTAHSKQHSLANTCRVMLNLNEFVFVD